MTFADQLNLHADPFRPGHSGAHIGRPLQSAFDDVMREIGLGTPVIVVVGPAGTGKTLLLEIIERACSAKGMSVRRVDRGDLADMALGEWSDLLLVDEADSLCDTTLQALTSQDGKKAAGILVLARHQPYAAPLGEKVAPVIVNLTRLAQADARTYIVQRATRAGRPDLFAPEALDALVDAACGSPRLVRSIGGLALFFAVNDRAPQIAAKHVTAAVAAQIGIGTPIQGAPSRKQGNDIPVLQPANEIASMASVVGASWRSSVGRVRQTMALAAAVIGALVVSWLLLGSNHDVEALEAKASADTRVLVHRTSEADALRQMERVAIAELPRPVILVVIAPLPLYALQIASPKRTESKAQRALVGTRAVSSR